MRCQRRFLGVADRGVSLLLRYGLVSFRLGGCWFFGALLARSRRQNDGSIH